MISTRDSQILKKVGSNIQLYSPNNGSIEKKDTHEYKKYTVNKSESRNKQYTI